MRIGANPALAKAEPAPRLGPSGFDPGEGSLHYRTSWPRAATPCSLAPLWKGEFRDFDDWVNFAAARLTGTTNSYGFEIAAICVDAFGRRCTMGGDFMRARDEGAFPVRYFWECEPIARNEAGTDETAKLAQPVGQEPDKLQNDAPSTPDGKQP